MNSKFVDECTGPCDWDKLIVERFIEFVPENSIVADIGANVGTFTFELNDKNQYHINISKCIKIIT